ncbi:MAG TPA: PIN domain-containing protein [Polyangia bacterium]|jgi:Predicted nucleic acid-binding protein, contains PIN domain|nr:PIN domain-containing protein [Polyangia bacterium]
MILVDTSVLIDFLRGKSTPAVERLARLEASDTPFAIPIVCCQEVMQGARDEREWRLLREHLSLQQLAVPMDPTALHWEAARIFFDCRRYGLTVRSSVDCLIAAHAIEAKATLLHNDEDFERIKKVRKGLRTERG